MIWFYEQLLLTQPRTVIKPLYSLSISDDYKTKTMEKKGTSSVMHRYVIKKKFK